MKKVFYGVIGLLLVVVLVSGCTSTNNNSTSNNNSSKSYASDLFLDQTTYPTLLDDGWHQNGWIANKDQISYANVTLIATGYTEDNKVIGKDKIFVPTVSNKWQSTPFEAKFKNKRV